MAKEAYMTVAQPGTKKVAVCGRRIGTRDRLNVIAMANSEEIAEKIVDALNLQQGKMAELEVPAQRVLAEVREQLGVERKRNMDLNLKVREKDSELSRLNDQLRRVSRDLASMTDRCNKLEASVKEGA